MSEEKSGLFDKLKDAAEGAVESVKDATETVVDKAQDAVGKLDDKAEDMAAKDGLGGKIAGGAHKVLDKLDGDDDSDGGEAAGDDEA